MHFVKKKYICFISNQKVNCSVVPMVL